MSFELNNEESIGLIGESGCGKSTVANLLLKLLEPSMENISCEDITNIRERDMREYRKDIQIIFNIPMQS